MIRQLAPAALLAPFVAGAEVRADAWARPEPRIPIADGAVIEAAA